jgi:hypothetical protein
MKAALSSARAGPLSTRAGSFLTPAARRRLMPAHRRFGWLVVNSSCLISSSDSPSLCTARRRNLTTNRRRRTLPHLLFTTSRCDLASSCRRLRRANLTFRWPVVGRTEAPQPRRTLPLLHDEEESGRCGSPSAQSACSISTRFPPVCRMAEVCRGAGHANPVLHCCEPRRLHLDHGRLARVCYLQFIQGWAAWPWAPRPTSGCWAIAA